MEVIPSNREIQNALNKVRSLPEKEVIDYIESVCDTDYDECKKIFEENRSIFAPMMIKRGMIWNKPKYSKLYAKYKEKHLNEYKRRNYIQKLKDEKAEKDRKN